MRMNKRILIIDDNKGIRDSFIFALEDTEYLVQTSESGKKAVISWKKKINMI